MEQSPASATEHKDTDDKDSPGGKKKNARKLGAFLVEPKEQEERPADDKKPESLWDLIKPGKAEEKSAPDPEEQEESEAPQELKGQEPLLADTPEASEAEAPLEELSQEEIQSVLPTLAEARQETRAAEAESVTEATENPVAEQMVDEFLEAVADGIGLDAAEATVLADHIDELNEAPEESDEELPTDSGVELHDEQHAPKNELIDIFSRPHETHEPEAEAEEVKPSNGGARPVSATPAPATPAKKTPHQENSAGSSQRSSIVGRLVERRRGRIKTEKKVQSVKKKLEKQIDALQDQLEVKEQRIRKIAANQRQNTLLTRKVAEQQKRSRTLEASLLHGSKPTPEQIGHMLVVAGAERRTIARPVPEKAIKVRPELTPSRIETLQRSELLELSETIPVEGSSLRQIYETHLIGEHGLRRLAAEHARGGDIHKALRREITEHEIDFERDPMLRDRGQLQSASNSGGGRAAVPVSVSTKTLSNLLEKANVAVAGEIAAETAVLQARAAHDAREQARQKKHQRLVDVSMVSTIALLIAIIILLILGR